MRYGTVSFDPSAGIDLDLLDAGDDFPESGIFTVFGELLSGTRVTLLGCFPTRITHWPLSGRRGSHVQLRANALLHGVHVLTESALRSDEAGLRIDGLRDMLAGNQGTLSRDATREWTVTVDGACLDFVLDWDQSVGRTSNHNELSAFVYVKLDAPVGLDEWSERWFRPLQHLVGFSMRSFARLESIEVILRARGVADAIHPAIRVAASDEFWERRDVGVLRPQRSADQTQREPLENGLIVSDDPDFETYLVGFLRLYQRLGRSAPFLFESVSAPSGFLETQLLTLTSAAEAFHRTQSPGRPLAAETHLALERRMLECLDGESQRSVYRSPVHYANQLTQRKRFAALVSDVTAVLPEISDPARTMANKLADTRNLFTHLDDEGPAAVAGERLVRLIRLLRIVMELQVLRASGVSDAAAADIIRRGHALSDALG